MSFEDQDTSLGHDIRREGDRQSVNSRGNHSVYAKSIHPDLLQTGTRGPLHVTSPPESISVGPPAPVVKSKLRLHRPPPPAAKSRPKLHRPPPSQQTPIPPDTTLPIEQQAQDPGNAQTQLQDLQADQDIPETQLQTRDPQATVDISKTAGGQDAPITQDPLNEQAIQQSEAPVKAAAVSIDQLTKFWEKYNTIGDKEDKEFVASAGGDLDNLLIFAGLFSAIDTAFIIESYKGLKPDPADEATKLLRSVVHLLRDPTYTDETVSQSFSATTRDIRVNCLLFASLCCSLSAAFGAVLAKQWLTQYDQDGGGSLKTLPARGRERQRKYEGRSKWHLEDVIVTLPTLLQFSLFFFLVGLADLIWPLNTPVASIIIAFAAATFLFYSITISISVIDRSAPFQTRLSALLARGFTLLSRIPALLSRTSASARAYIEGPIKYFHHYHLEFRPHWVWPRIIILHLARNSIPSIWSRIVILASQKYDSLRTSGVPKFYQSVVVALNQTYYSLTTRSKGKKEVAANLQSVDSQCVVHLLERMTVPKDLDILAEAVDSLPDNSGRSEIATALSTFHLKPTLNNGQWGFLGLHGQSQGAILKMLRTILGKWEHFRLDPSSIHYTQLLDDLQMREALLLQLWDKSLAHPEDQEVFDTTRRIYLKISGGETHPIPLCYKKFLSRPGVVEKLKAGPAQERTFRLVCLLHSLGGDEYDIMGLLRKITPKSPQLIDMLQSTMWEAPGHRPDLETFCLATFRVEILSSRRLETLVDSHFPEYLATWFNYFAIPDYDTKFPLEQSHFRHFKNCIQQQVLYWTYLLSLRHLLKHTESGTWSQKLVRTGHLACLRVLLEEYPHGDRFCAAPLALWAILCLWNQEEAQVRSSTSLFLKNDCVQLVVRCVKWLSSRAGWVADMAWHDGRDYLPNIWSSQVEVAEEVAEMLDWLFDYLKAAMRRELLDGRSADSTVQAYSRWWAEVNSLLPAGKQRRDRSHELYSEMRLLGYYQ